MAPLRHRNFRLLVTGTTVISLGNAITPVALAFAVLDLGGSATELGIVVAAFALAEVVTALFGGVLGDRLPRKLMMQGAARRRCRGPGASSRPRSSAAGRRSPLLAVMGRSTAPRRAQRARRRWR